MTKSSRRAILLCLLMFFSVLTTPILSVSSLDGRGQGPQDESAADIVLVGNSYTQANNLHSLFNQIISHAEESNVSELSGGGMRFDQHADRMNSAGDMWNTTLQNNNLDWVMLQDQSQVPGFPRTSQYWQNSLAGLVDLTNRAEEIDAESVLFMTWGYREGDSTNTWRYPDYKTMQHHLRDGYIDYRDNTSNALKAVWIAPVGLAYEHIYDNILLSGGNPLDSSSVFWNLYSSDGAHPSLTGSYLTACVMYATIYGNTTVGNSDSVSIDSATKLQLQQAADATVFNETVGLLSFPWMAANWSGAGDETADNGEQGGNNSNNNSGNSTSESPSEHISFGANPNSSFGIDAGTSFRLTVNLSNNATVDDNITVMLYSSTGWNYSFNSAVDFPISKQSLEWVDFTIDIPEVTNGNPLAGIDFQWSLTAHSNDFNQTAWWNFSIDVNQWHEIEIATIGQNLTLAPNSDGRIPITILNTGNTPTKASVKLQLLIDGVPDANNPAAERIEAYGWTIALFNNHEMDWISVGDDVTFEVGILSPGEVIGNVSVEVRVSNDWGEKRTKLTTVTANITWLRDGEFSSEYFSCSRISPSQSCDGDIAIINTGNYHDSYIIELVSAPDWLVDPVESSQVSIPLGGSSKETEYAFVVASNASAFGEANITYQLRLENSDIVVDTLTISIGVAPMVEWQWMNITDESNDGTLSIQYVISNLGNGLDGITVIMDVTHGTEQGLIPPNDAEYEGEIEGLRSFSQNNISVDERYTFRAWADIPENEPENGTIWLNLTARSHLNPDFILSHSVNASFIGTHYIQSSNSREPWVDWSALGSSVVNSWNSVGYTFIAIIISGVAIHLALKRRLKLNEEEKIKQDRFKISTNSEVADDWLDKFAEGGEAEIEIPQSPEVSNAAFVAGFRNKGGSPSQQPMQVEEALVGAATTVLDHHEGRQMDVDLETISEKIDRKVVSPHPANVALPSEIQSTDRTQRIERRNLTKSQENVPLPKSEEPSDDELDL